MPIASSQSSRYYPKQSLLHGALLLANSMFGLGSIIGALGLPSTNPLAFTAIREIVAGALLLTLSWCVLLISSRRSDDENHHHSNVRDALFPQSWDHFGKFCRLGMLLFGNQSSYILGIVLAGPVTGSIWQPSAPIFTAALSMLWGLEQLNVRRLLGLLVAFAGCVAMVVLSDRQQDDSHGGMTSFLIGNALFFLNCFCTACYILLSKNLLQIYPSLTVTSYSYNLAAPFMFVAAILSSHIERVESLICATCEPSQGTFYIPNETIPALAYYIVAMSVGSWGLILWSDQYATGTLVMGYTVTQPVTSLVFTTLLLTFGWVTNCEDPLVATDGTCLNKPGLGTICGMIGVFCGLSLIVMTEPSSESSNKGDTDEGSWMHQKDRANYGAVLPLETHSDEDTIPASSVSQSNSWMSRFTREPDETVVVDTLQVR